MVDINKTPVTAGGSATARNLEDRFADMINARDFGASPSASAATNAAALQAALDAAASSGCVVFLPHGDYSIGTTTVTIPGGVTLRGEGRQATYISYSGTGNALQFTIPASGANFTIEAGVAQLTIKQAGTGETGNGFVAKKTKHCRIDQVEVLDFAVGILIDGGDNFSASNQIVDPLIGRCTTGLKITADSGKQANHTQVFGGYIYGTAGILAAGGKGILIEQGDSNYIFGTGVESFGTGIHFKSVNPGGNYAIFPRAESNTTDYLVDSGVFGSLRDPFGTVTCNSTVFGILSKNQMRIGDRTGSPVIEFMKDDAGRAGFDIYNENIRRWAVAANASENFIWSLYDTGGSFVADLLTLTSGATPTAAFGCVLKLKTYTVATLPAAATVGAGAKAFVTDGSAGPTWGATVAGGGSLLTPVYSDGTNWKIG